MTDIRVIDLVGPICVGPEEGVRLYDLAREILNRGDAVCLDFSGVTTLATSFLSIAVGGLYGSFSKDDLGQRLRWTGLDTVDEHVLRIVQQKATLFYSATPALQEALLSSSAHFAGE